MVEKIGNTMNLTFSARDYTMCATGIQQHCRIGVPFLFYSKYWP